MGAASSNRSRGVAVAIGVAIVALALDVGLRAFVHDGSIRQLLMLTACNTLVAVSLNVINGMAGQFSIGHAGFVGVGAYTAAIVASHLHALLGGGAPTLARSFLVVPPAMLAAAAIAGVAGLVLGLPSLRLKGDYLAIVTLGFAEIFRLTIASAPSGASSSAFSIARLGGSNGYAGIDGQGVPLYAGPFWIIGIAALGGVLAWRLKFSGWGRALRALREDEIAAASVGIDPTRYKVTSFVIAAVGGGVAGALIALMRDGSPVQQPDAFGFLLSFDAITMVILGGSGSVTGSILGAVFVTLSIKAIELAQSAPAVQALRGPHTWGPIELTLDLNALRMIFYAVVVVALMVLRPTGLLGERELFAKRAAPRGAT
jgi:branched-chain amino acid transport system permease protein